VLKGRAVIERVEDVGWVDRHFFGSVNRVQLGDLVDLHEWCKACRHGALEDEALEVLQNQKDCPSVEIPSFGVPQQKARQQQLALPEHCRGHYGGDLDEGLVKDRHAVEAVGWQRGQHAEQAGELLLVEHPNDTGVALEFDAQFLLVSLLESVELDPFVALE